jgi:hypothetical protein
MCDLRNVVDLWWILEILNIVSRSCRLIRMNCANVLGKIVFSP